MRAMRAVLRSALTALTDALEKREGAVWLDPTTLDVVVDSTLDDVDARPAPRGYPVPLPDGLWEWGVRRDFVRALPAGKAKQRLGATLGGPRTRRRFEVTLAGTALQRAFRAMRRRRLRAWSARVLRCALSGGILTG